MRAYIYQGRNLPGMDDSGVSDPYVEVYNPLPELGKDPPVMKTEVQNQTNNPLYYQTIEFAVEYYDLDDAPPIVLNVYDTDDGLFDSDDYMGRAVIFLNELTKSVDGNPPYIVYERNRPVLKDEDKVKKPSWFPVSFDYGDPHNPETDGMLLVAFSMHEFDRLNNFMVPAKELLLYKQIEGFSMPNLEIE